MSAFTKLWDAKACLRDSEDINEGSVARRWVSAAVSFKLRSAPDFYFDVSKMYQTVADTTKSLRAMKNCSQKEMLWEYSLPGIGEP